jgi:hypothetical protein
MMLCITTAETCREENDGAELLGRRLLIGSKEIVERVQYGIDDVHHDQRP